MTRGGRDAAGSHRTVILTLTMLAFAIAWWLGLYLIARDPHSPLLRRAGLGLLAYIATRPQPKG